MAQAGSLKDFEPLGAAERQLVKACVAGRPCFLGDRKRPEGPDESRRIRAGLLRFLILGGGEDCQVHAHGVYLQGAWVPEPLKLDFARTKGQTVLVHCRFDSAISALQAHFVLLVLSGSRCPGLIAQGAEVTGNVFLSDGFHATGEVSLSSARIGGQLACEGGRFGNKKGHALFAQRMRVEHSLIWRNVRVEAGCLDLNSAHVGVLADDPESWPEGADRLILDGFTYEGIASFTDAPRRLKWLAAGSVWEGEFYPQPYTECARVLRAMGHDRAARDVLVEQGRLIRLHVRKRARVEPNGDVDVAFRSVGADLANAWRWVWDLLQRWVVGYGYKPYRSIWWLIGLWAVATLFAWGTWQAGAFAPNSDYLIAQPDWQTAMAGPAENPAGAWLADTQAGRGYERFHPLAYGFDVVVPVIALGQEAAWRPMAAAGGYALWLWWLRWLLGVAGWVVIGLAAAAVTGIIQRK